ncbi:permease prefix domain 1-containing protein [Bacillus atrophaeus]|uniref:permease prefix domain 1-containing protein n=1 Tax=Bacillus atrophaeus TaxID=1452 RepID=UPI002281F592|nr:permease prefix domain 1-containing protein [Bacillus atrophaeus]MCY8477325.1 permease prefix domain 1-containing protein [Bacillus atrophaeus]
MDKDDYVNEIKKGLQDLPDSDEWMEELESHIGQAFAHYLNEGKTEKEAMMRIWHEIGSPADIIHSLKKKHPYLPAGFYYFISFATYHSLLREQP